MEVGLADVLRVVIRSAHIIAAAAWVGGSLFYAFVLWPHLAELEDAGGFRASVARSFGRVIRAAIWTLLATGGVMTFDRLTNARLGAPYVVVLAAKVLLAVWMFLLAGSIRKSRRIGAAADRPASRWREVLPVPRLILALGLVVFVLGATLATIYQSTPSPP